jgi:hypothetical protein
VFLIKWSSFQVFKILFLLLVTNSFVVAQGLWSVKGGLNLSVAKHSKSKFAPGYTLGLNRKFSLDEKFGVSIEVNIVRRSFILEEFVVGTESGQSSSSLFSYNYKMNVLYIELPVLVHYSYPINKESHLIPYVGFSYSHPLSYYQPNSNYSTTNYHLLPPDTEEPPDGILVMESSATDADTGIIAGLEYQYRSIFIDVRYYLGLRNINNVADVTMLDFPIRTISVQLGVILI